MICCSNLPSGFSELTSSILCRWPDAVRAKAISNTARRMRPPFSRENYDTAPRTIPPHMVRIPLRSHPQVRQAGFRLRERSQGALEADAPGEDERTLTRGAVLRC